MSKKQSPEKVIRRLIDEALRSYIIAAKNRRRALEYCDMAFEVNKWEDKGPPLTRLAATLARVCDTMSQELQTLYALEERLHQVADKGLHIVIEHIESRWASEHGQNTAGDAPPQNGLTQQLPPPDSGQSEA